MGNEKQSKTTAKPQPVKPGIENAGLEPGDQAEIAIPGVKHDPMGELTGLPPNLRPGRIARLQRISGNRSVQRDLAAAIQREAQIAQSTPEGVQSDPTEVQFAAVGVQRGPAQVQLAPAEVQRNGPEGGGNTTPIPKLPDADARHALAVDILKKAYGGMVKADTKVDTTASEDELRARYDQAMIRMGRTFKQSDGTERPWAAGDSRQHPEMSGEFTGFYDPSTGQVNVDTSKPPDEQVATIAHELLHASAAGDFQSTFGKAIDEGMTESLTQKAFTKAGYAAPTGFFTGQIAFVGQLASMFGENTMMYAYFSGTSILRSMMETTLNEAIFDRFAAAARANDTHWMDLFFQRFSQAIGGSEVDKKIAAVNSLLDGWVSDADISNIENIYHGSSPEEQTQLKAVISGRITSLMDFGQRGRLRILIGG
jgi:hypothetical protein